jgi:hypothetical protein
MEFISVALRLSTSQPRFATTSLPAAAKLPAAPRGFEAQEEKLRTHAWRGRLTSIGVPAGKASKTIVAELLGHRLVAPANLPMVWSLAKQGWLRVLPRYHRDTINPYYPSHSVVRHLGVEDRAPLSAYKAIAPWQNAEQWVDTVADTVANNPDIRTAFGVSTRMMNAWAQTVSLLAQRNPLTRQTGYGFINTPKLIASMISRTTGKPVHERTVQRCNALATELGLRRVIREGRMLTLSEREQIQRLTRQRGLATEVALTIPQPATATLAHAQTNQPPTHQPTIPQTPTTSTPRLAVFSSFCHPSQRLRLTTQGELNYLNLNQPDAASRRSNIPNPGAGLGKDAATRRQSEEKAARHIRARQLARQLTNHPLLESWLGKQNPRKLYAINKFVIYSAPYAWTADELAELINHQLRHKTHPRQKLALRVGQQLNPARIWSTPAALLASLVRYIDPVRDHPRLSTLGQPCLKPGCSGDGWQLSQTTLNNITYTQTSRTRPCPTCPPQPFIRALIQQQTNQPQPPTVTSPNHWLNQLFTQTQPPNQPLTPTQQLLAKLLQQLDLPTTTNPHHLTSQQLAKLQQAWQHHHQP